MWAVVFVVVNGVGVLVFVCVCDDVLVVVAVTSGVPVTVFVVVASGVEVIDFVTVRVCVAVGVWVANCCSPKFTCLYYVSFVAQIYLFFTPYLQQFCEGDKGAGVLRCS